MGNGMAGNYLIVFNIICAVFLFAFIGFRIVYTEGSLYPL